jgi:hypothetical protein
MNLPPPMPLDGAEAAMISASEIVESHTERQMLKTYKYRIYPSPAQVSILERWFALLCELYNAALQERRDA